LSPTVSTYALMYSLVVTKKLIECVSHLKPGNKYNANFGTYFNKIRIKIGTFFWIYMNFDITHSDIFNISLGSCKNPKTPRGKYSGWIKCKRLNYFYFHPFHHLLVNYFTGKHSNASQFTNDMKSCTSKSLGRCMKMTQKSKSVYLLQNGIHVSKVKGSKTAL